MPGRRHRCHRASGPRSVHTGLGRDRCRGGDADSYSVAKIAPDQVTAIAKILTAAPKPLSSREVARAFDGKRASTIEPVFKALAAIGQARLLADGRYAA